MSKRSPRLIIQSTRKYVKYLYVILAIFLALVGVFCTVFSKIFVNRFIDSSMQLRPGSKIVDMWSSPDVNVTLDFFFFNWTNSEEFANETVKPKLKEIGPYSFYEVPEKEIFQWHPENNTLDYGKKSWYYFDEARSKRPLDDQVITVNALMVSAASKTKYWSFMKRAVVDMALRFYHTGIVWKRTAEEFLFKGFEDNIVNLLSMFPSSFRSSMGLFVPWDRIGFTYDRNGTTHLLGTHTIGTGVGDMDRFGKLLLWKGKNFTEHFPEQCSSIKGSAGELQKINLKKNESLTYFFVDFCRSVTLDYLDEVMVEGVLGYRYVISPEAFDNGTINPFNECYCNGECVPYGAMNITSCWFGLPVFISNPHFMDADPFYLSKVEGLKPNESVHRTTAILEPRTGFMLELKGRLQLNFYIQPSSHIRSYRTKRRMLFPVLWFDMQMRISKNSALLLRIVKNLEMYCHIFGASIIVLTLILILWRPLKSFWKKQFTQHMEISTVADDEEEDHDDIANKSNDINTKEALYLLRQSLPSIFNITHPRRSLPVIISYMDEDEALSSCLEDSRQQDLEKELENLAQDNENS